MSDPIDRASSFRFGVALGDNIAGLFAEDIDPSVTGFEAPVTSLLFAPSFGIYEKVGAGDTDWQKLAGGTSTGADTMTLFCGRRNNASNNSYLQFLSGRGSNQLPAVMPWAGQLTAMSLKTDAPEDWRAQIYVDGTLKTGAFLDSGGAEKEEKNNYSGINFSQGDEISVRCVNLNTGNIRYPGVVMIFRKS